MYIISDTEIMVAIMAISFTTGLMGAVFGHVLAADKHDRINELENRIRKLEDEVEALDEVVDVLVSELKKVEPVEAEVTTEAEAPPVPTESVAAEATAAVPPPTPVQEPAAGPVEEPQPEEIILEKAGSEHRIEQIEREFQETQSAINKLFISGATAVAVAGLASWSYYLYESPLLRGATGRLYEVY
jgi:outer membrane biosynthesis protein TonB